MPTVTFHEASIIAVLTCSIFFLRAFIARCGRQLFTPFLSSPSHKLLRKVGESFWLAFGAIAMVSFELYLVITTDWALRPSLYFAEYHAHVFRLPLKSLYALQFSNYLSEAIHLMFFSVQKSYSDFWIMITHHCTSLFLIGFSYHYNFLRIGLAVMFLHDPADIFLECGKLLHYKFNKSPLTDTFFYIFAIVFIVPRLCVYPFSVLIPVRNLWNLGTGDALPYFFFFLFLLYLMNFVWSVFILRMAYDLLFQGKLEGDIRSDHEKTPTPSNLSAKVPPHPESE